MLVILVILYSIGNIITSKAAALSYLRISWAAATAAAVIARLIASLFTQTDRDRQ